MGRLAVDYHRTLREDHDLKAFGFAEIRYADRTVTPFQGYGIQYDRGNQVFTNPLIFQKLLNEGNNYFALTEKYDRGITFSASGTYGYKGKYIANAVLNYGWSWYAFALVAYVECGGKVEYRPRRFLQQQKHQCPCPESQLWAYCQNERASDKFL